MQYRFKPLVSSTIALGLPLGMTLGIVLGIVSAAITSAPALAQGGQPVLEEVVVTAQRREQNLQDVPASVTAFGGAGIQQRNITSAIDYLALTPGVSYTEDGQTGSRGMGIAIRGINSLVTGENAFVNSVGIYLDEFSVASVPNNVANPNLADMDRVEILRGPQGTHFGRNAVGGALNLTTQKPTDEFEGKVILGAETYEGAGDQYNFTGILNVPVDDSFAMRGVLYYMDSDGFVENACASGAGAGSCPDSAVNNFTPNGADGSEQESLNLRLHLDFDLGPDTNVLASIYYTDDEQDTDENVPAGVLDLDSIDTFGLGSGALDPGTGFWPQNQNKLSHDLPEATDNKSTVAILNVTHALNENTRLKWVTGIIDAELDRLFDNDLAGGADAIVRTNHYEGKSWSTELRMEMSQDKYDLTVGLMYANDEQDQDNNVATSTQPTATVAGTGFLPPFPAGLGLAFNTKNWELESWAVFADVDMRVTDRLDVIIGARYTEDDVSQSRQDYGIAPTCCFAEGGFPFFQSFANVPRPPSGGDQSFDNIAPRFVLRYEVSEDMSVYGQVSRGYKAGGLSLGNNTNADGSPAFTVPFDEETLTNYELGLKSEWMQNRVRLNASLYRLEWEDLQMESFRLLTPGDISSNFEQTINIEEAEAWGTEIELLALVNERLTLTAALGYIDSEITSDTVAEITGGFEVELEGLELPKAPEFTFSAAAEYRMPLADGEAWVLLEFIHRDGQFADIEALTYEQTDGPSPNSDLARNSIATFGDFPFRTPDYDVWNLRAGWDRDRWGISVYAQNLGEEEYYTGTQENFGTSGFRLRPHPRIFGARVSFNL